MNIDPESGLINISVEGAVTRDGMRDALHGMINDPGFQRNANSIWNFLEASIDAEIRIATLYDLISFLQRNRDIRGSGYKVAVVTRTGADIGIVKMFSMIVSWKALPFKLKIFDEMVSAQEWVNDKA